MAGQKPKSIIVKESGPKAFNDFITQNAGQYDFYVFCNESVKEVVPDIEEIYAQYLYKYENEFIGAVYSDGFIKRAHTTANYILPGSSDDLFRKSMIFTPVIAVSGQIRMRIFNEKLKYVYFYDALRKMASNSLVLHCPIRCYSFEERTFDLNEDLANL